MAPLTPQDMLLLCRIAGGRPVGVAGDVLTRLVSEGLIRHIAAADVALVRHHQDLLTRAEELRTLARRSERPGGLRAIALKALPSLRRNARDAAEALRREADSLSGAAKEQWLDLSRRSLVDTDISLCSPCRDGAFLTITEAGRQAARGLIWSEHFERECADDQAIAVRAQRYLALRDGLGYLADPRTNLTAAMLSGIPGDHAQTHRALNGLATTQRWVSYDRLPLLALLCPLVEDNIMPVWDEFWEGYECIRRHDYAGGYESRVCVALMMHDGVVGDAACERLWEVTRRLRRDGWSMSASTDPVAARLCGLRLSPTRIAARVQQLYAEMERDSMQAGPFLALASSIAAQSSLHPLALKSDTAGVMEQSSVFGEYVTRYDEARDALQPVGSPEDASAFLARMQVVAALIAMMPGTVQGNLRRLSLAVNSFSEGTLPLDAIALGLLLADSAFPDWFDASRFCYEIACLMHIHEPTSMFTAFGRMSPMYYRAAQAAEMFKPPGPAQNV